MVVNGKDGQSADTTIAKPKQTSVIYMCRKKAKMAYERQAQLVRGILARPNKPKARPERDWPCRAGTPNGRICFHDQVSPIEPNREILSLERIKQ